MSKRPLPPAPTDDKGLTKQPELEVRMATNHLTAAFRALLSDLAEREPRHGFQAVSDVQLSRADVGAVVAFEPDTMADALVDVLPSIAAQLAANGSSGAVGEIVVKALTEAAHRVALREIAIHCDEIQMSASDDRAHAARQAA